MLQTLLLRDACGSYLRRWEHSTWLPLGNHSHWELIQELAPLITSGCRLVLTTHHNNADDYMKLILAKYDAQTSVLHTKVYSEVSVAWAFHPMVYPITIGR